MEHFSQYMGPVFEEICKQWMWRQNKQGLLPFTFLALELWWRSDPRKKSEAEIYIVASDGENSLLFCECKWTNKPVDATVLETLIERSQLLSAVNLQYVVFLKSGFTDECREIAKNIGHVRLVTFGEMM